jgi:acyl-coenzyme A synthetase/AMP-(fatty) acid ligase/acyl carrier protein
MKRSTPELDTHQNGEKELNQGFKRLCAMGGDAMVEDAAASGEGVEFASLHQAIDSLVTQYALRPAVEDELGISWTYAEMQEVSLNAAAGMSAYKTTALSRSGAWPAPVALLMQRTCSWVATCIGAMRVGVPSLSLSGDLRNAEEAQRNREALAEHLPFLLVLHAALRASAPAVPDGTPVVDADELLKSGAGRRCAQGPEPLLFTSEARDPDEVLYIVYTGGTTSASKSVAVTHRMALHELKAYPHIAPLQCTDRVLHQSSAYWGATSLGIFDVAWTCGGCLVLSEGGAGPAEVAAIISKKSITTIGVVPSVLEALEPEQCPSLRVIFTWGEALAPSTAARWAKHAALLDLLIASEYWLILVSDHRIRVDGGANGEARTGFRPVPGARLTLLPPPSEGTTKPCLQELSDGQVGELYFAGPMVSSIGYTDSAKNKDAFIDLPVGDRGDLVRHFRTRDLARRRADGSLEYCGRADGFAKVGGKWLDLAAVERRMVAAGCSEAALVWDERAKKRHAAVILEKSTAARRSLSECATELLRLLPRDTTLHMRASLPHNPATGKLHRGRLVEELATETATSSSRPTAAEAAVKKAGRALLCGLLLAGRAGARGPFTASLAWGLAPGLRPSRKGDIPPALAGFPEGLSGNILGWTSWHRQIAAALSGPALDALPHIALLLVDAEDTGLEALVRLFTPIGLLGAAMMVAHSATPFMRWLLVSAGRGHARRARGAAGWAWAFWISWPFLAFQWESECWSACVRGSKPAVSAEKFFSALSGIFKKGYRGHAGELPSLRCCNQCGAWVERGELWRSQFYCSKCNEDWEKYMAGDEDALPDDVPMPDTGQRWGQGRKKKEEEEWVPGLSEIDFTAEEAQRARTQMPAKATASRSASRASTASPIGRIVERCSGIDASESSASLGGLESLKVIAVVSALRRELGFALAAGDVTRCRTVGELEELCARVKAKDDEVRPEANGKGADLNGSENAWAVLAIPRFWRAPVGWLIRLDNVPEERAMRAAACALVRRHPGLRACPYSKSGDEYLAEMCNRSAPIVLVMRELLGKYAKGFVSKASKGFCNSWPKVIVKPPNNGALPATGTEMCNFEWHRFSTMADMRHAAWLRSRSRGFKTPASMAVLIVEGGGDSTPCSNGDRSTPNGSHDVAYLHVAVNHAVCDAFCIVPLLADLLTLHGAALKIESSGPQAEHIGLLADQALDEADLPRAPNGLAVQEARLRHALDPQPNIDAQDISHNVWAPRRRGYDHYVRMKAGACSLLEAGSGVLGIPPDHLLVVAIACSFAVITQQPEVKLSLIVPMRDGEGEGQIISNLATTRHLSLCFGSRSFLAVALDLSQRLRRREFALCDFVGDDGDRLFINIRDTPKFEGAAAVMENVDTTRATSKYVRSIMEMFVDRETESSWAFSIGIRDDLDGHEFAQMLGEALWRSAMEPLGPALPVRPPGLAQSTVDAEKVSPLANRRSWFVLQAIDGLAKAPITISP